MLRLSRLSRPSWIVPMQIRSVHLRTRTPVNMTYAAAICHAIGSGELTHTHSKPPRRRRRLLRVSVVSAPSRRNCVKCAELHKLTTCLHILTALHSQCSLTVVKCARRRRRRRRVVVILSHVERTFMSCPAYFSGPYLHYTHHYTHTHTVARPRDTEQDVVSRTLR